MQAALGDGTVRQCDIYDPFPEDFVRRVRDKRVDGLYDHLALRFGLPGRELHRGVQAFRIPLYGNVVSPYQGVGVEEISTVRDIERAGKSSGKRLEITYFRGALGSIVNHQRGSAVCHVQVDVEGLAHVPEDVHGKAGREQAGRVGIDDLRVSLAFFLEQVGTMAEFFSLKVDLGVVHDVGNGEVHVFADRDMKDVTGLVCVYDVREVVQHGHRLVHVVEREIYVVCVVRENVLQICPKGGCHAYVCIQAEHGINFSLYVGYETHFIADIELVGTVTEVLVHQIATGGGEQETQYAEKAFHIFMVTKSEDRYKFIIIQIKTAAEALLRLFVVPAGHDPATP